jgi:non-ribosomal peptide synthase protein (TIGR01720 family)
VLDVAASVIENRLQLVWTYSENLHRRATVEALADNFMNELCALIAHCRSPAAGGHTPSDFPLAGLEQGQLDGILTELGEEEFEAIDE